MNKAFSIVSLFLSCTLAGCSTASVRDFNRGIASEEQFDNDSAACEFEAEKAATPQLGTLYYNGRYSKFLELCMKSKGYRR